MTFLITNIFLNQIFVIAIDLIAVALAIMVARSKERNRLSWLYVATTALMLCWVNFAYLPRVLAPEHYALGILSLKFAWFVTPPFFLFLYLLSEGLAGIQDRFKTLTVFTMVVAGALSLVSGFTDLIISGFQVLDGVTTIIYGPFKIPYLIGVSCIIVATVIPLLSRGAVFKEKRLQAFAAGLTIFLVLNGIFNITLPMFYGISRFYFFGDYSTLILLAFIAYAITSHRLFDTRVVAAEMISVFIWTGISVQFLLASTFSERTISAGTLMFSILFGIFLIRSVRREVEQRELIEQIAQKLEEANTNQEILIRFISHEVKNYLAKDVGAFHALLDGDFGKIPDELRPFIESALGQSNTGLESTLQILTAANQRTGKVSYAKTPFDLAAKTEQAVSSLKPVAEAKKLALNLSIDASGAPYTLLGDEKQIADHVLRNLIDNAVNYTPAGAIEVSLKKADGKIIFAVKDTGVGITDEDKAKLFTEGGHGAKSQTVNVHSTGYGLFIAKNIVVAHGGTIRAESEGEGKGSTFIVEFPVQPVMTQNAATGVAAPAA